MTFLRREKMSSSIAKWTTRYLFEILLLRFIDFLEIFVALLNDINEEAEKILDCDRTSGSYAYYDCVRNTWHYKYWKHLFDHSGQRFFYPDWSIKY